MATTHHHARSKTSSHRAKTSLRSRASHPSRTRARVAAKRTLHKPTTTQAGPLERSAHLVSELVSKNLAIAKKWAIQGTELLKKSYERASKEAQALRH